MTVTPPTDAELDTFIRARLATIGIDVDQLHPTERDPETGSPSQASVLSSIRGFLRGTVPAIAGWAPPTPPGEDAARLSQQVAPPLLYPSVTQAWTGALDEDGAR